MILQGKKIEELLELEWLATNELGGYASSSIIGANTRKYHGLLIKPNNPPTERRVLVSKIEERIGVHNRYDDISSNVYPNSHHPNGENFIYSFERTPMATWNYKGNEWGLEKKIAMVPNSNTTMVSYKNTGTTAFEIELHPLFVEKDYHSTFRQNHFDFYYENPNAKAMKIHSYPDSAPVYLSWTKGDFTENRAWYHDIQLPKEDYRGQDFVEDYYRIGFLSVHLGVGEEITVLFSTEENMIEKNTKDLEKLVLKDYKDHLVTTTDNGFYQDLVTSGRQFIVNRASTESKTIIAGYHWFTDWGRDTMIAMRGLTIAVGDQKTSTSILSTFTKYISDGMLPNRFPDYEGQEVEYNTIDASLWLFIAAFEYYKKFKDAKFIQAMIPDLIQIIRYHIDGTRYNIHVNEEGLVYGGEDGWQLTWMDARVNNYVVTPRIGCPVEINALWYNALCIYNFFCKELKYECAEEILALEKKVKKNFKKYFLSDKGYLNDVIIPNEKTDDSFRPNQIYAVSLPFSILSKKEEAAIVQLVGDTLLTDYGLKTLNSENENYKGHYGGNQWDRDISYHQGIVWPFLLMEYWEAYLKVNKYSKAAKKYVINALEPLKDHFYTNNCVHGISEIFDGDNPKNGRGCVQQAWSVAALVKLYSDYELYDIKTI